jgi:hypothetical protein
VAFPTSSTSEHSSFPDLSVPSSLCQGEYREHGYGRLGILVWSLSNVSQFCCTASPMTSA